MKHVEGGCRYPADVISSRHNGALYVYAGTPQQMFKTLAIFQNEFHRL